jgi:FKBP-type peptidyl-prolyl cis-trans isomerase FklB
LDRSIIASPHCTHNNQFTAMRMKMMKIGSSSRSPYRRTAFLFCAALLSAFLTSHLVSAGSNEKGVAFLEANRVKPGVVSLPSGLQYKVLREGTGISHPTADSPCSCHYEGTLIDGTKFDSSYDRGEPTTFAPNQVIKGWTEAMQLMVEGDKWEMYIPSDLAYGDRGSPPKIGGGEVLIFTMEIIEIQGKKVDALKCKVKDGSGCNEKELKYIEKIKAWEQVKVDAEVERLVKTKGKVMKDELREWFNRRFYILKQLATPPKEEEEL